MENSNWYTEVNTWCKIVSLEYNVPMYKVVGILSALSPRNRFNRNLDDTITLIEHGLKGKYGTFHNNRDKALRILNAKNISEVLSEFKGLKTRKFFLNIYKVFDYNVTVDVWMIRMFKKQIKTKSLTNKSYLMIEKLIQKEANKYNLYPNQMQAVLWSEIRGANY